MKFDLIFLLIPKMQLLVNISVRIIGYACSFSYSIYNLFFQYSIFILQGNIIEAGYKNSSQIYRTK